ncbi:hypothetical protein B0T25DRAFT_450916 [Lasiosphaeria hispida]|uniref:Uncharacterized protein n=1 Tax=Lasiosphaeria hispida TaxID=260671 RepID=A0AAJ0HKT3_9PEZI|nr:hypothetical protein B0T25DRAFT_450916 [Lasiosphaeria hispida]
MRLQSQRICKFLVILPLYLVTEVKAYWFPRCEDKVLSILNGTYVENGINNVTIRALGYLYEGPIKGLKTSCPRSDILTLTMEGCKVLCGNTIKVAQPSDAMSLAATWVFPLAIIFNLPYESYHGGTKVFRTLRAVLNWLGSPQTALAATLWNFRQIRRCHRRSKVNPRLNDAMYVLSCLNQFDLSGNELFFKVLVYGLFRPTAFVHLLLQQQLGAATGGAYPIDMVLTEELLATVAYQLRMLRRRSVIPTLGSLGVFLVAFVFSVVLTFGDLGHDISILYMAIGLFVMWLPMLVTFSIVDRNPISSERSAYSRKLLSRWMYNVNAVRVWGMRQEMQPSNDQSSANGQNSQGNTTAAAVDPAISRFPIGSFVGQGRVVHYCGVVHAVLESTKVDTRKQFRNEAIWYDRCGTDVVRVLAGPKPGAWWAYAWTSFSLVWAEIMMAVMLAMMTPTVGPGCWSGSCFLYGAASSMTFFFHLFCKEMDRFFKVVSFTLNSLAFTWLLATIIMQLSGVFNNCYCFSSPFAQPYFGGYMDFGDLVSYRRDFNVVGYWTAAAAVGGLIPVVTFVIAVFWWLKCSHLWNANESMAVDSPMSTLYRRRVETITQAMNDGQPEHNEGDGGGAAEPDRATRDEFFRVHANMDWLQG